MANVAPGHRSAHSEPPPCYNCGMRGHIFTACPEPTRAVPAGLEASRARQASGNGSNAEHPNKRHKGPIVTRYSQPPPSNLGPHQYPSAPPGQHYSPAPSGHPYYSYPPHQTYPPGPSPTPYHSQYGSGQPSSQPPYGNYGPVSQSYGGPPFTQQPYHPHGQPNVPPPPPPPPPPFIAGLHQYPHQSHPQHYTQHTVYPPPQPYGYGPPPGVIGPPTGFPSTFQPAGFQNDSIPPPSYSGYAPPPPPGGHDLHNSKQHPHDNQRRDRPHDRYSREKWKDRRGDKRGNHGRDRDRHPRDYSRDENWHGRGRQSTREGVERRKHEKPYNERTAYDRELFRSRSRPGSEMSSRSGSQKPVLVLNNSSHTTPKQHISEPTALLPFKPEETIHISKLEDSATQTKSYEDEKLDTGSEATNDIKSASADTGTITSDNDTIDLDQEFLEELEAAFAEPSIQHHGDPVAEPLPNEYSEAVMLPPAFDAKGVKSKHVTPANLDDFALSVRDTNQWSKYRHHPVFLAPNEVNLQNLAVHIRLSQKNQGNRYDKRGRQMHAQYQARDHGRTHRFTDRGDQDQRYPASFQKKRKWEDRGDHTDPVYGREIPPLGGLGRPLRYPDSFGPPREMSPEPGEISDTPTPVTNHPRRPTVPLHPSDDSSQWHRGDFTYLDDQKKHHPVANEAKSYDDDYPAFDRPGAPLHYGGHSRSPHYNEWEDRSSTPTVQDHPEQPNSHEYVAPSPSPKPLLDELQSHIDRICAETASGDDQGIVNDEQVRNHNVHLATPQGSDEISPRRGSQGSGNISRPESHDGPASRPPSIGDASEASDLGSPLTRIEAELLGLVGADGDDSDADSPKRRQEAATIKRKPRKKVHSVYDRRW